MKGKDSAKKGEIVKGKDSVEEKGKKKGRRGSAAAKAAPSAFKGETQSAFREETPPAFNWKTPPAYMDVGMGNLSVGRDILLSDTDPDGSYTGISREGDDRPVQDADDL